MTRPGLLLLCLLLAACAVPLRVDQRGPDFDGTRTLRMRGNVVPTPMGGVATLELNAERRERPGEPFHHALLVEVRGEALRIRPGASLHLILGGDTLELTRDSTTTAWLRVDPSVTEQARYPASDSVMLRVAAAPAVEFGVRAGGWWERRSLSARNLEVLREWVAAQVHPDSVVPAIEPPASSGGR